VRRPITERDNLAAAIAILYDAGAFWRRGLSHDEFCMTTFPLCSILADGSDPRTLQSDVSKHLARLRLIRPGGWTNGRWCSAVVMMLYRRPYGAGYRQPCRSRTAPCHGKQRPVVVVIVVSL
jgi:hypothetical protein